MTRAALTFAEIFIVLALIFIIQTVVNFGLYDEMATTSETPNEVADYETLSIRQVPSLGNLEDHVLYLYFAQADGKSIWIKFKNARFGEWEPHDCRDIRSLIDQSGRCVSSEPCSSDFEFNHWDTEIQRVAFLETLKREFKVSLDKIPVSDAQDEYLLSWVPADLPGGSELRIGLEFCRLQHNEESRRVDPAWELHLEVAETGLLLHPHPLVLTRTRYGRDGTPRSLQQEFAHFMELAEFPGSEMGDYREYRGTVFVEDGCRLDKNDPESVWRAAFVEVVVSLSAARG